ncbi:enolase C-terminal domain-like protein [Myriangium duriaei CBS 260.36]|uniref:Enolase C-terminal domain-like protein n=1 Tax=Myriangium duriaei CBS 260.36 TaxID=1168546 RepID=A0A9P4MCP3_9PEZI|nr:enolase C-terminal domain-like protein [Myriangium duriaei CBS 260.36]
MRIIDITIFSYKAKYIHGTYTMSGGRSADGWAETSPLGSDYLPSFFEGELAALKKLSEHVLGLDPRLPAVVNAAMDRVLLSNPAAKAVLDCACWDLYGKAVGLPTHVLLGGAVTPEMPDFKVVGVGDAQASVKHALAEVDKGVRVLQLKIGDNPVADARRAKAVSEAVPHDVVILADANAGWNLSQALTFVHELGQNAAKVILEQPCPRLKECAEVARRSCTPVILDECIFTVADLVEAHAAGITGFNLKLSRVGGITKARVMRDTAVALGMMVTIDDTWGCSFTTVQNIQLAATTPSKYLRGIDVYAEWTSPFVADVPRVKSDGHISVTELPGNGYSNVKLELLGDPLHQVSA